MTSKGGPYFALTSAAQEALMVCKHCTYCCNALNECLFQEEAWPKLIDPFHNENFKMILDKILFGIGSFLENHEYSATLLLTSILFLCCFLLVLFLIFVNQFFPCINRKLSKSSYRKTSFQDSSIYKFFLVKVFVAVFLAFTTLFFHILILVLFLNYADYRNSGTEAAYAYKCPSDSLACSTASKVTSMGFSLFTVIVIALLATNFADGILMIYVCCRKPSKRWVICRDNCFVYYIKFFLCVLYIYRCSWIK